MSHQVILPKSVQRQVDRLTEGDAERVLKKLAALESQPRPPDCKKLKGRDGWRVRVGDYRILYQVHDRVLQVVVISIGHRREVYR